MLRELQRVAPRIAVDPVVRRDDRDALVRVVDERREVETAVLRQRVERVPRDRDVRAESLERGDVDGAREADLDERRDDLVPDLDDLDGR
jgi:hypothetical protein